MAYVADFTTLSSATRVSSLSFTASDFPDHVADDYLVLGVTTEADGTTLSFSVSGWTQIGSTVGSSTTATGLYSAMFYLKCTGSAHTATITITGATAAIHAHAFLISDADTTTFLDGTPSAAYVATATAFNAASIATGQVGSLILYYMGVDSTTTTPTACHSDPGPIHFLDYSDNGGASTTAGSKVMAGACAGWYMQRAAGTTPTPGFKTSLTAVTTRFTVGIRNKSGGQIPAYIDDVNPLGTQIMQGTRVATSSLNGESFPSTLTLTQLTSTQATTYDAGAVAADGGINPYSAGVNSSPTISSTTVAGFQVIHTSLDMTTGWIVGAMKGSTSKMALYNQGNIKKGGVFLTVGSGTTSGNNYRSFQILGRDNQDGNGLDFSLFSVQPNQTQTRFGTEGAAAPSITAMTRFGLWQKAMQGSGTTSFIFPEVQFIKKVTVAGGTASFPVNAQGLAEVGRSSRLPLIKKVGANELMAYVPVQIGGGDAVNFQIDGGVTQFPRIYSPADKEVNYHGASGAIGISYAGKSGDVIKHTNSITTSPSPYYWEINSAATSSAEWDYSGHLIVGANVTLRNVMTFDKMSFASCPAINWTGCTLTNASVSRIPNTNDSLVVASATISYSSFDTTGLTTAGNRMCSVATPSVYSNCEFLGSASTGHAIRITTPGTYSLVGNIFTGYGADGSTSAAIYNDSGGLVTLNISGGGSTPTVRNGTSASTVVNSTATVQVDGLVTGTRVLATKVSDNSVIHNGLESSGSVTFSTSYAGAVKIEARKASSAPYYIPWITQITTVIGSTVTATALQQPDE